MNDQLSIGERIVAAQADDEFCQKVIRMIEQGVRRSREISLGHCEVENGQLFCGRKLVVPEDEDLRLDLLKEVHDSPAGGHYGAEKIIELIKRQY